MTIKSLGASAALLLSAMALLPLTGCGTDSTTDSGYAINCIRWPAITNDTLYAGILANQLMIWKRDAPGAPFATGTLGGVNITAVTISKGDITDPVFGTGQSLKFACEDGGYTSVELYDKLPFALIRRTVKNAGTEELDIRATSPFAFTTDLGKPASALKTMGTAGLRAADKNPGSYLYQTVVDPETRAGVVSGWLTCERGSGVWFTSVDKAADKVDVKAQIDYGHLRLAPGQSEKLETLVIGRFDDARLGQEAFADALKKQYAIKLRPQMTGYCTWYSEVGGLTDPKNGAGALNEKDIVKLADFAKKELSPFGFSFIQIDDEWQDGATNPDGSRINGPRRGFMRVKKDGPYPSGMAATAKNLADRGFTTGIWFLPFAANHQDKEFPADWFMKRRDGMPYETVWGGTSLDVTKPEVKNYLRNLAKTIHGWGINYFKMDGLWTGTASEQVYVNDGYTEDDFGNNAPFHDKKVTNMEALRLGLKTIREGAGPDVFFSGCNASQNMRTLGGVIGLVDSMRIGPDNGFEWQDWRNETMHFEGGGIITGPIRASRLYFMNGRTWWNDPDPAYVRPAVKLEHARLLASWVAVAGAFNLNSDWIPGLPAERLDILKRCMPSHSEQARPVDYFDKAMPEIWLLQKPGAPAKNILGLYNWESKPQTIGYDCAKAGLKPDATYHAFDFWGNKPLPDFKGSFSFELPKESCLIVAAREATGRPVLVSTSRHVTQGVIDIVGGTFLDGVMVATSKVVANDPYEIRIAGLNDGKGWKFVNAGIHEKDAAAGVKIEALPQTESGWLRLRVTSPVSREVQWSAKFE